jgi:hypothetical protein
MTGADKYRMEIDSRLLAFLCSANSVALYFFLANHGKWGTKYQLLAKQRALFRALLTK